MELRANCTTLEAKFASQVLIFCIFIISQFQSHRESERNIRRAFDNKCPMKLKVTLHKSPCSIYRPKSLNCICNLGRQPLDIFGTQRIQTIYEIHFFSFDKNFILSTVMKARTGHKIEPTRDKLLILATSLLDKKLCSSETLEGLGGVLQGSIHLSFKVCRSYLRQMDWDNLFQSWTKKVLENLTVLNQVGWSSC